MRTQDNVEENISFIITIEIEITEMINYNHAGSF